jgi:DNA polymerase III subunit delta'
VIDELIIHPTTRGHLEGFAARPGHALLLTGPSGIGKTAIAEALCSVILGAEPKSHPYFMQVRPDGFSISIEEVRQLQKFLQLKTVGARPFRRAVVVEYAHLLTTEAQNAFLKLLEEPPADTFIILTTNSPRALLPTILSRVQSVTVHPPAEEQLQILLDASAKDERTRKQAYFLSGGLPGLLSALLNDQEHPLLAAVAQAKEVLQKSTFEKLAIVDGLSKQKTSALDFVEALERIAQAGLQGAATRGSQTHIKQWHQVRKATLEARDALKRSANTKLVLSNLLLSIH